jgi:hypothetical protein
MVASTAPSATAATAAAATTALPLSTSAMTSSQAQAAQATQASGPYTIVDRSLRVSYADRFAVDGDELLLFRRVPNRDGREASAPAGAPGSGEGAVQAGAVPGGFEAIRMPMRAALVVLRDQPGGGSGSGMPRGVLLLSDGQRFAGEPAQASQTRRIRPQVDEDDSPQPPGDERASKPTAPPTAPAMGPSLVWRHQWLGDIPLEMDRIRSIVMDPLAMIGRPIADATANDQILLVNGDRLEGIVVELGPTVRLERDVAAPPSGGAPTSNDVPPTTPGVEGDAPMATAGGTIDIPIDRIAAMSFITPEVPVEGPRVWCADGTVLRAVPRIDVATGLIVMDRGAALQRDDAPSIRPQEVLGFAPDAARILPLSSLVPAEVVHSGETPRVAVAAPERTGGVWAGGAAPIVVRGPTRISFEMPVEGCAIVAEIRVFDPDPAWTDCEVILRDGDREVLRRRMIPSSEPLPIVLPLETRRWSIEVSEGELGPIRDAIELRRAVVILPER